MLPRLSVQTGVRAFVVFDALVVLALAWLIAISDLFS
jgi:hypothetical protein